VRFVFVAYDGPNNAEGPIVNFRRLIPALKRQGHDPHALIIRWGDHSPAAEFLDQHDVPCRTIAWPSTTEKQIQWMLHAVNEIQPDIFVANYSVSGGFAARWVRDAGIPTVTICRSDDDLHWNMAQQFITGNDKWSVSGGVCVDEDLQRRISTEAPNQTQLTVIPSGVPIPKEPVASHSPFRLAYLGRLTEEQKCISKVTEAICSTLEKIPHSTAVVLGDGPDATETKKLVASRGLSHRIEFTGLVPHDELSTHLKDVTVSLLLSDYEGTPGALMDSMSHGVVPICRDIRGGVQQLVLDRKTGLLVDHVVESAVDAAVELANNRQTWQQLSRQAREHVTNHFSLESAVNRWEIFAQQLLISSGPHRKITIPKRMSLPPTRQALASMDTREKFGWRQKAKSIERKFRGLKKRVLG